MKFSPYILNHFQCPVTKQELKQKNQCFVAHKDSTIKYPIVDGIPVLINERNSLFSIKDFVNKGHTTGNKDRNLIEETILNIIPSVGMNINTDQNYEELADMLPNGAKILIVGGRVKGAGIEPIYANSSFEIVSSDVTFGPQTNIIFDGHDVPFKEETFDCVIIQAVLEHVIDPYRCVDEIYRVLKPAGIVYAETPFMQQVHGRQYDFTRFTHLGQLRLFRDFEKIKSGLCGGPGMALAWSYKYFLRSFASHKTTRRLLVAFAHLTSFFLKYFDPYLIDKPGAYDAASGYYLLARKSNKRLTDRELLKQYRGFH